MPLPAELGGDGVQLRRGRAGRARDPASGSRAAWPRRREGAHAPPRRLLHEGQRGARAPRSRAARRRPALAGRRRRGQVDLHHRHDIGERHVAVLPHLGLHAQHAEPHQLSTRERRRRLDGGVMLAGPRRPVAPARGDAVGVRDVGRRHPRVVVEAGGPDAVGDAGARRPALPGLAEEARAGFGRERVLGHRDRHGRSPPPRGEGDPIAQPVRAAAARGGSAGSPSAAQSRRPGRSVKPPSGFHAACARPAMPDPQPPIPRKILELGRSDEDVRVEPGLASHAPRSRSPAENSAAVRLAPYRVAGGHALAPGEEPRHQAPAVLRAASARLRGRARGQALEQERRPPCARRRRVRAGASSRCACAQPDLSQGGASHPFQAGGSAGSISSTSASHAPPVRDRARADEPPRQGSLGAQAEAERPRTSLTPVTSARRAWMRSKCSRKSR